MRIILYWVDLLHYHVARINSAFALAKELGHEVIPVAVRSGSPELPVSGYQYLSDSKIWVLASGSQNGNLQSWWSARQMLSALDEINPDVVAIPGYDTRVALASLIWCRRYKRGAVLMTESKKGDFPRNIAKEWVKRYLLKAFDSAIAGGTSHIAYLKELGMPSERIISGYDVVGNEFWASWAETVHLEPHFWRERLNLPEHFFLVVCRLVPKKNVAGVIKEYASYLSQVDNPWKLVIVGDGPLRIELEGLAGTLGISNHVSFLGYLSAEEIGPVYGLAAVFILASAYAEQWGLVVNEAMAAGLPVLVSNVCGCANDLVENGVTGYTFDPSNEGQLADLMTLCSSGKFDLEQMGRSSQIKIENFSPDKFAKNLLWASQVAYEHAQKRRI